MVTALATHMGNAEAVAPCIEVLHALCRHLRDEHYAKMVTRIAKLDGRRLFYVSAPKATSRAVEHGS